MTYEWALAKGAGCEVRSLRLETAGVSVPPPLSSVLALDDMETATTYYATQRYSSLSLAVLLRDLLRPLTFPTVLKFRRMPGEDLAWEHPDIACWPEEDRDFAIKSQLGLRNDRPPRIARIAVRLKDDPPRLILDYELEREFKVCLVPEGNEFELEAWWRYGDKRTVRLHPAFWRAALEELVSLLDGQSTPPTQNGAKVDNLFPVTWA